LLASPTAAGNVNWKTAPFGRFGDAHSWPPWASTIERQIDSPIPIPSGFVVKKASKSRSFGAKSSPRPESVSRRERKKVEMLFAHLKRILGLGKLRLRGPNGAKDEFLLAATAQNLRKLAKLIPFPAPIFAT
jgi:hypothetical protein